MIVIHKGKVYITANQFLSGTLPVQDTRSPALKHNGSLYLTDGNVSDILELIDKLGTPKYYPPKPVLEITEKGICRVYSRAGRSNDVDLDYVDIGSTVVIGPGGRGFRAALDVCKGDVAKAFTLVCESVSSLKPGSKVFTYDLPKAPEVFPADAEFIIAEADATPAKPAARRPRKPRTPK